MTNRQLSNKKFSLIISVLYVLIGTIYAIFFSKYIVNEGVLDYILLPVTFIPSFLLFVDSKPIIEIFIGQLIVFGFVFMIVHGFVIVIRGE